MSHRPRKRFGQHFLQDPGVVQRILAVIRPRPGEHLVEIGPGEGALTRELLKAVGELDAIELDRDLIGPLARRCTGLGELHLYQADALRFDFCALAARGKPLRLTGNLPYNISTPLLFHLLDQAHCIQDMQFMLQKEVVDRLAAAPGNKTYGRLSVMVQARCRVEALFDIGPEAFQPPPKVYSSWVRLTPSRPPSVPIGDPAMFARVVAEAFSQRRKTLRNALRKSLSAEQISGCGIAPELRPERLGVADYARLARRLAELDREPPHISKR